MMWLVYGRVEERSFSLISKPSSPRINEVALSASEWGEGGGLLRKFSSKTFSIAFKGTVVGIL